ncbi:MAG: hypothetical protein RLZ64_1097, partial [Pseudomonadota bacterium]
MRVGITRFAARETPIHGVNKRLALAKNYTMIVLCIQYSEKICVSDKADSSGICPVNTRFLARTCKFMNRLPTLSDAVATHARLAPNKLAARDSRRAMTFTALNQRVQRLAEGLCGLGLSTGDRVAVLAYNSVEWVEIYAALARA